MTETPDVPLPGTWPPMYLQDAAAGPHPGNTGINLQPVTPPPDPIGGAADGTAGPTADPAADVGTVLGTPEQITLVSGLPVRVRRIASAELFALLDIAIGGLGDKIKDWDLDPEQDNSVFLARFVGMMLAAIPKNAQQTFAFLRMCCEPAGLVTPLVVGKHVDKATQARNDRLNADLDAQLVNPDPDDLITIVEAIAKHNAGPMRAWGKRLAGIVSTAMRSGMIPASPTFQG